MSGLDAHTVHCIACGESHMLAVIDNGSLAAWGSNEYGQLGKSRAAESPIHISSRRHKHRGVHTFGTEPGLPDLWS